MIKVAVRVLMAFGLTMPIYAECTNTSAKKSADALYSIVKTLPSFRYPSVQDSVKVKPYITNNFYQQLYILANKEAEVSKIVIAHDMDYWPCDCSLFLDGDSGYEEYAFKSFNYANKTAIADFSVESAHSDEILSWSQKLMFSEENGMCVIDDIQFSTGQLSSLLIKESMKSLDTIKKKF